MLVVEICESEVLDGIGALGWATNFGGREVVVDMGLRVTASLEPHNQLYRRLDCGYYGTGEDR